MDSTHETIVAVVVAAGSGTRLKSLTPKPFVQLGDKPLFAHSLAVFDRHPRISAIVIVVHADHADYARNYCNACGLVKPLSIVKGGKERWQSVQAGVAAAGAAEWVLVHDCARPFVSAQVIDSILEKMAQFSCVITVTPETDTVRLVSGDRALETVDRTKIVRVGTPQLFRRATLVEALSEGAAMNPPPTDEAMLMQRINVPVGIAWGDPLNFKITTPQDMQLAEALYALLSRK